MNLFSKKNKKIKICFVSLYAYHYFNQKIRSQFGGAELQLYNLATKLAEDSCFDVYFIVGDFGQPNFEIRENVKLYKFFNPCKKLKYSRAILGFIRLWKLLKKIDADIHIQRAVGLETCEVALFCKLHKKKFIYMVANDEDVDLKKPEYFPKGIVNWIRWRLFKFGLKNAALVFVQHKKQAAALKKNYKKEGVIRQSIHSIIEAEKNISKEWILWAGKAEHKTKHPEMFIELVKSFSGEKFIMICPASNDQTYFEKLKTKANKISNLRFIDYVPFNEINDYFLKAKIFVNTSKTEGFPNTFIQAAKSKTPILSLNVNPDGMLEKFNIGKCANNNFEQLKIDLKEFLENKKLWQEMSENAYKYAKENHDIRKIIEEDKKLIISLAQK